MIKHAQIWGWDSEPVDERPSRFAVSAAAPVKKPTPRFKREPPSEFDLKLSAHAAAWNAALPAEIRPDSLCILYPRIANRIAICWADPKLTRLLLDDLLGDNRGGRKGYPMTVGRELARLRAEARRLADATKS